MVGQFGHAVLESNSSGRGAPSSITNFLFGGRWYSAPGATPSIPLITPMGKFSWKFLPACRFVKPDQPPLHSTTASNHRLQMWMCNEKSWWMLFLFHVRKIFLDRGLIWHSLAVKLLKIRHQSALPASTGELFYLPIKLDKTAQNF